MPRTKYCRKFPDFTDKDVARFWSLVAIGDPEECWKFQGGHQFYNYGEFRLGNQCFLAHRVSFIFTYGNPENYNVLHSCDNPPCVNPEHLFIGTHKDNMRDCAKKGRTYRPLIRPLPFPKEVIVTIFSDFRSGIRASDLAARFGLSVSNIQKIINSPKLKRVYFSHTNNF